MHRPANFQDMILLAERADQSYMADRSGMLQQRNYRGFVGNGGRGGNGNGNGNSNGGRGGFSGRGQQVGYHNVSQYGNSSYKGPAPMVLGAMGEPPVCYYCNKPGHVKRDCYKLRNDQAGGRVAGRGQTRGGGRHVGRGTRALNVMGSVDVQEIMRLGMAAQQNKDKQLA